MMIVACSMVVRSAASGAVLCTALASASLIFGASLPIERASSRIGTTSATTASTTTMPITQPMTQPVLLNPAARACGSIDASSDRFTEVAYRLQAGVDRGQPVRDGAGQVGDRLHPSGGGDQRGADGPEVEDHPQQAHRGDRDDQRGDDQREPGGCWHGRFLSTRGGSRPISHQPRSLATEPA